MKLAISAVILAAGALAGTALAQGAPTSSPPPPQSTTPAVSTTPPAAKPMKHGYDPDTVICKWTEEIGTRLGGGKTCMTRLQWDQLAQDSEDVVNSADERSNNMGLPTK